MWNDRGIALGEHPLVLAYIRSITNDDFLNKSRRKYRYDDTWDVQLLLDYLTTVRDSAALTAARDVGGIRHVTLLRSLVVPLARVLLCCRSDDLTCIYPGVDSDVQCVKFTRSDDGALLSASVRFFRPKQRNHMPVSSRGYTDWVTIDVVDDDVLCFASLLEEYFSVSATLPRMDDRLFITERVKTRAIGKCWGLSSQRLAKIMKQAMEAAGIPDEFLPHSARHAGQAYLKSQGYSDDDVMARANMSARTYVTHYRRRVRRAAPEAPPGKVVAGAGGGSI
eukprot:SAG11_NODE_935_length_6482_cov_25.242676_4_plen_280_part_00